MSNNIKIGTYKITKDITVVYSITDNLKLKEGVGTYSTSGNKKVCEDISEILASVLDTELKNKTGYIHEIHLNNNIRGSIDDNKDQYLIQIVNKDISATKKSLSKVLSDIRKQVKAK